MFGLRSDSDEVWERALDGFAVADAEAMRAGALLRRAETKFVVEADEAHHLLRALQPTYAVYEAGSARIATYSSTYFDTPDLEFFRDHRRGRRRRCKVRIREYIDRDLAYMEIKRRVSGVKSTKLRLPLDARDPVLTREARDTIDAETGRSPLRASVVVGFRRITLVGSTLKERVTIDLDLTFRDENRLRIADRLAIVEVKQWPRDWRTPVMRELRRSRHRAFPMSKYSFAILSLRPEQARGRLCAAFKAFERYAC